MNTLLGELATYNDIQYPRHRFAFKLRKLQTTFLFQYQELAILQDIFHSTGVQPLDVDYELTENQIKSILAEVFSSLKKAARSISQPQLQEAHVTCLNWLLMAFHVDTINKATVGRIKVFLTMLCGSKSTEKAKYLFTVLAKNGTLGRDGIQYFCETIQIIGDCLSEVVYSDLSSVDRAMSECMFHVRDHDDIVDEEEDGGLQRPWLSCFELVKVFGASPPLNFLSWMDLWFSLPQIEKIIHNIKCSICNKKSIVGFRYQCAECSSYHMCQMCFLKGRTSEPHVLEHKVFECVSYSKSLKSIFSKNTQPKDSRIMDDFKEAPTLRLGMDYGSNTSLQKMGWMGETPLSHIRSPSDTPEPSHKPTELRIGSRTSLNNPGTPKRGSGQIDSSRLSISSAASFDSTDGRSLEGSISSVGVTMNQGIGDIGLRKQAPILSSLKRTGPNNVLHNSLQKVSSRNEFGSPVRKALTPTHSLIGRRYTAPSNILAKTSSDGMLIDSLDEFNQLNRKFSCEVDQILKDMEADIKTVTPLKSDQQQDMNELKILNGVDEERLFKTKIEVAEKRKSKLSTDLDTLLSQIHGMQSGFTVVNNKSNPSSPIRHQLHTGSHHQRGGSLDMTLTGSLQSTSNSVHSNSFVNRPQVSAVW